MILLGYVLYTSRLTVTGVVGVLPLPKVLKICLTICFLHDYEQLPGASVLG
jgi:hypothetical protein